MSKPQDYAVTKTPHRKEEYSIDQILEFKRCADPVFGPKYFLDNYYYIQHPTKGSVQFEMFDYQSEMLEVIHNNKRAICLCGRQLGKTTLTAGYLLWSAMFIPDYTILVAAHIFSGAQEIMQRVRYGYEYCPDFIRAGVVKYNQGSIDFENGSRIVSRTTTENTGRGMSISLLYMDELAAVRGTIQDSFWASISPTLATGGKAIITSTPLSDEDLFARLWQGANKRIDEFGNPTDLGINGFKPFKALWHENPERDEKWERDQRAELGDEKFEREHNCEFIIDEETLIDSMKLTNLIGVEPLYKQGQVRWYKRPEKGNTYVVGLDPAVGTGGDHATIQVIELPSLIQVAEWQHNKTPVEKQISIMGEITKELTDVAGDDKVYYSVENNTLGEAHLVVIREVGEENIKGYFMSEPKVAGSSRTYRKGFNTTNKKKLACCTKFKNLVEKDKLTLKSKNLLSELKTFIASGAGYAAKPGDNDDLVTAMLLCVSMIQQLQTYDDAIDMSMRQGLEDDFEIPLTWFMGTTPFSL